MNIGESAEILRRVAEQGERIKELEQRLAYLEREVAQQASTSAPNAKRNSAAR